MLSSFADKDENINTELPSSDWDLNFSYENGTTQVSMIIRHTSLADLEKMLDMGFQGGFTMTLNYLDKFLSTSTNASNR